MLENAIQIANQDTFNTYNGTSGTIQNTINGEMFIEDWPVNLIKVNGSNQTINGVRFTVNKETGTITANGTATTDTFYQGQYEGIIVDMTSILEDEPLFFSGCPVGGSDDTYFLRIYTQNNSHKNEFGEGVAITNPRGFVGIKINEGYTCNNLVFKPMLVKGSQPRGFIPYEGGEVKTCGKNLLEIAAESQTIKGITFTVDKEVGTVTVNGTATENAYCFLNGGIYKHLTLIRGETYTLTGCPPGGSFSSYLLYDDNKNPYVDVGSGATRVCTIPDVRIIIRISVGYTCNNLVFKPMLIKGAEPQPFEPYIESSVFLAPDMPKPVAGLKTFGDMRENLIEITAESRIINGVTFTVDKEVGTITANGTATNDALFMFPVILKKGCTYYFSGCPAGGNTATYMLGLSSGTPWWENAYDFGDGISFTYAEDYHDWNFYCVIKKNYTANNLIFKPELLLGDKPRQKCGETNIISDFDVKLMYAKRQDKYMEALLMNKVEIAPNAGAHNSIFRGKFLGNSVTNSQYSAIKSGRFDDLFIGDYWTINDINYRIAHFDYYLKCSDPIVLDHHVVLVPDTTMGECQFMNTSNGEYASGNANNINNGYVGSGIYSGKLFDNVTDNAFAIAKNTIKTAFGEEHIMAHKLSLSSQVGNRVTNTRSVMSEIELMTEKMVYGTIIFSPVSDGINMPKYYEIEKTQLMLFALDPSFIVIPGKTWWLRDILSSTQVADVYSSGGADYSNSTNVYNVRPSFCIYGGD